MTRQLFILCWFSCLLAFFWLTRPDQTLAQAPNGITEPESGAVVSGVVIIRGTADDGSFLRYELSFNNGGDWIVFAEGDQPIVNGTLAIWDTTIGSNQSPVFPDGVYQLRLRVVRNDFNYDEYFVSNLTVANSDARPTETPTATATITGTENLVSTPPPAGVATEAIDVGRPTVLPSLTPFPTPSPQATPVNVGGDTSRPADGGDRGERQGVLAQITAIDGSQFGRAFRFGAAIAFYLFGGLALYLLGRMIWRRLWRNIMGP